MSDICFDCINKNWNNKLALKDVVLSEKLTVCQMCHNMRNCVLNITPQGLKKIADQIENCK